MSASDQTGDGISSRSVEESDTPRKLSRLENPARKSWSLMDRRTDQDVLQEMGVSLLEPDENDLKLDEPSSSVTQHRTLKRKHNIENVNPNVNSVTSPLNKLSPRTAKGSPGSASSRIKSPRIEEKWKSPRSEEKSLLTDKLNTSSLQEYQLVDEETPLAQAVSVDYPRATHAKQRSSAGKSSACHEPLYGCQDSPLPVDYDTSPFSKHRTYSDSTDNGSTSFSTLSDEMILSVFKWLPKRTLAHAMLVCKRWYRVASDETLWQRLDLGNRTISKNALGMILARKHSVIRLASSEIGEWHPSPPASPSRVQYLDLSMCTIDNTTLCCLLERCTAVKKLSLESVVISDEACQRIGLCKSLETLNLTMAHGVPPEGLTSILDGCTSLQSLNISWCGLKEDSLEILANKLPTRLLRLNIAGARVMTDDSLASLCGRCPRLQELDISDCPRLTAASLPSLITLTRLEHLALSRCYLLPPHTLPKLSSMPSLQYLEVWGMLHTASLNALRSALPHIQINQFMFSAIARPTVGTRRTSIWGLRTRD